MSTRDDLDHLHWRTQGELTALRRELFKEQAWLPEGDASSDAIDAIYERMEATELVGIWNALKLLADRIDELSNVPEELETLREQQ